MPAVGSNPTYHIHEDNMIGFDLDGTITNNWMIEIDWTWNKMRDALQSKEGIQNLNNIYINLKPRLIPIINVHIITGRPPISEITTVNWLKVYDIKVIDLHMGLYNCFSTKQMAERKAEIINDLNLTKYFEDEEKVRKILTQLCPDTEILTPEDSIRLGFARRYEWK